ncbi:MAG: YbhB/YbcL family Raf kinase inhibitor-like protein [Oceanobacter sp.]
MKITSRSLIAGETIPAQYAFAIPNPDTHVSLSDNLNPHIAWSEAPEGTKSFALVCCDPDVPSVGDDVNQEGKSVPADLPRVDFYHWLLWNIPATTSEIEEGAHCNGVTARGKPGPLAPEGFQHGINDYTGWFAGDADMEGSYFGYDGPCPPWNDERLHHYVFTVYALDVTNLSPISSHNGKITGTDLLFEMKNHILASASLTATYSLNPAVTG